MRTSESLAELSPSTVTSSEPFDRSGPVPAAVRAAGYVSEEEEETDEDGSSIEEETDEETSDEEEEEHHRHHAHAHHAQGAQTFTEAAPAQQQHAAAPATEAPSYSGPAAGSGVEVGPNGYAVEKKGVPPALGAGTVAESSGAAKVRFSSQLRPHQS